MNSNCSKVSFPCGSSVERDVYHSTHKKGSARHRLQDSRGDRVTQGSKLARSPPAELVGLGV